MDQLDTVHVRTLRVAHGIGAVVPDVFDVFDGLDVVHVVHVGHEPSFVAACGAVDVVAHLVQMFPLSYFVVSFAVPFVVVVVFDNVPFVVV